MFSDGGVDRRPAPELEETNYIEPEPEPARDREPPPRAQAPSTVPNDNLERDRVVSTEQMCKDEPVLLQISSWMTHLTIQY